MARQFHLCFFLTAALQILLTDAAAHLGTLATLLNHEADNLKAMAVTLKAQEEDGGPDYRDEMEELAAVQAVGVGTSMLKMALGSEQKRLGGRTGSLAESNGPSRFNLKVLTCCRSLTSAQQASEASIEMTPYVLLGADGAASEDETLAESYDRSGKCADAQTGSSCREARSQRHWPHTQPLKEAHLHEAVRPVPKGWSKAKASILQQEMQELELLSEFEAQSWVSYGLWLRTIARSVADLAQASIALERMFDLSHLAGKTSGKPGPTALQSPGCERENFSESKAAGIIAKRTGLSAYHRQFSLSLSLLYTISRAPRSWCEAAGVEALAAVESGCCLLAESPVAVLQLQNSKTELPACQQCLCPLSTTMCAVVCQCGDQFCSTACYEMAKQQGHERLCPALLGSQEASAMESLIHLLRDLPNVGEAFRLAVKLLARAITDLQLLELSSGLAGAPWWETAGISDHLIQEARDVTQVAFTLLQAVLTDLPAEFTADDLGFLVGRLRMRLVLNWNAVEVLVPVEDQLLAPDLCGAAAVEGLALYFVASAVNHSCHPNCALQSCFASPGLRGWAVLQALRPIDEGEEVTIAYLEDGPETCERLFEQWRFHCSCDYCASRAEGKIGHVGRSLCDLFARMLRRSQKKEPGRITDVTATARTQAVDISGIARKSRHAATTARRDGGERARRKRHRPQAAESL
ncbi:Smyd3 [Symbiodinium sp. CCMP2592]|nr:Smyd3 [Symbiodinium sp. CCMP2592]